MKKMLAFTIFLLTKTLYSQDINIPFYVSEFEDSSDLYSISLSSGSAKYEVKIEKDGQEEKFKSILKNLEVFKTAFKSTLEKVGYDSDDSERIAIRYFYEFQAASRLVENSEQKVAAGYLKVGKTAQITSFEERVKQVEPKKEERYKVEKTGNVEIENVVIVFKDGFIEDISALVTVKDDIEVIDWVKGRLRTKLFNPSETVDTRTGKKTITLMKGDKLYFSNKFPIGFTSKRNIDRIQNQGLLQLSKKGKAEGFRLGLNEFIEYIPNLDLNTKDYTPKNGKYTFSGGESKNLYKVDRDKIFEVIAFSDFLGIQENNPNGLVQFDFNKSLALNTYRRNFLWLEYTNYGFFNNIELDFLLSKIEENNRQIVLSGENVIGNDLAISTLDAANHQVYSIGADINWLTIDDPDVKFKISFLSGFRYGRVLVSDPSGILETNDNEFGVNTTEAIFKGRGSVFSEKRFGLTMEAGWKWLRIRSVDINQVDSYTDTAVPKKGKPIFFYQLQARYNNNSYTGNVFVRYQFNQISGEIDRNFSQFQLGYNFNVFGKTSN